MTSFFSLLHAPLNFQGFVRLSSNLNGVYTWVFLQARSMQSLFSKLFLEIASLKFIHFIIIQNDRYSKPVGRDVNLEQMIAWYMGKTSQNQLNPQEKRKKRNFFMLYSADVILMWHLVLWELILLSCVFKFLYHEKSHFCDRCDFSRLIPLQPRMLLDHSLWLMSTD